MIYDHVFLKPKNLGWLLCITGSWFWNSDRIVQSNSVNCEPFFFAVLLALRTSLCKKSMDSCEPQLNHTILKTVNSSHGSFFFSKYRLKLKIWPACKLRRRRWQSRGYVKLKQQASNLAQIASHGLHLHLHLCLLLLFLLLTSFSSSSLSSFCLHCCGFRFSPSLCLCLCWFFWISFLCF